MKVMTRPAVAALSLLTIFIFTTVAQQKRQAPAKPQPKPATAAAPAPTFDTLVPAEKYTLYGEVRGVGQLIKSSALTEALEPILKLAGPPKEFKTLVKWLNAHADEVMTSRLLVATWPVDKTLPEAVIAIEFASAEEAAKFAAPLNTVLTTVLPPVARPAPESQGEKAKGETPGPEVPPKPSYHMQQSGSLILLTPAPLTLKKLKPAGSKPLTEDVNFRSARNRFNSESIFVFVDVKLMERQEEQTRKQLEAQRKAAEEQKKATEEELKKQEESKQEESKPSDVKEEEPAGVVRENRTELVIGSTKEPPAPDPVMAAVSMLGSSLFSGTSKWPDAIAFALGFENESFDLRALFVNQPGEKSDTVPFMPMLIPGPPIVPETPNILPADTELFVTMSLDLPQIYSMLSKPRSAGAGMVYANVAIPQPDNEGVFGSPFATIEEKLKISLKDDLLPLLGSEVALRIPVIGLDLVGLPKGPTPEPVSNENKPAVPASPLLLISLRDKEAVRTLMPRIVEAFGFKGASSFAQTERKEDTELVSYLNFFSYAFIRNFLVLSADAATVRHVVDSYLKHETLAGDSNYRNYTRWQPRPTHGQLYISPALMESYKTWAERTTQVSDHAKAMLTRLTTVAQPITYSLSNEGLGPLHEVRIPRNLVLMAIVGISGEVNAPPDRQSERMAIGTMHMIAFTQEQYKKGKGAGNYGTIEQLIAENMFPKEMLDNSGYKFEMVVTGDKFELFAVPAEYGKSGKMSYFIDQTRVLRGADRGGAAATSADPPIN